MVGLLYHASSHEDPSFSLARSIHRWSLGDSCSLKHSAACNCCFRLSDRICCLVFSASCRTSPRKVFCWTTNAKSGAVMRFEASNWLSDISTGFAIPKPPNLVGRANRSRSRSPGISRPVSAGMNFCRMALSTGSRRSLTPGAVLDR